jgi:hypothetical protein
LFGVPRNVPPIVLKLLGASDQMVELIDLPEFASSTTALVYATAGETLPFFTLLEESRLIGKSA